MPARARNLTRRRPRHDLACSSVQRRAAACSSSRSSSSSSGSISRVQREGRRQAGAQVDRACGRSGVGARACGRSGVAPAAVGAAPTAAGRPVPASLRLLGLPGIVGHQAEPPSPTRFAAQLATPRGALHGSLACTAQARLALRAHVCVHVRCNSRARVRARPMQLPRGVWGSWGLARQQASNF